MQLGVHHHTARQRSYLSRRAPPGLSWESCAARSRLGPRLAPGLTGQALHDRPTYQLPAFLSKASTCSGVGPPVTRGLMGP
eukprot:813769-Amphidinium_carterae.1